MEKKSHRDRDLDPTMPLSNLSEIFSYTTTYSNFMFLIDYFLSYRAKTHTNTHTDAHTHTDSDEYFIGAFYKNATITITF